MEEISYWAVLEATKRKTVGEVLYDVMYDKLEWNLDSTLGDMLRMKMVLTLIISDFLIKKRSYMQV